MSLVVLRAALLVAASGGCWVLALAVTRPLAREEASAPEAPVRAKRSDALSVPAGDGLWRQAVDRPPFRADRRPASAAYDPERTFAPEAITTPRVPKPVLTVTGVVWGAEPAAVVEGMRGSDASVVIRPGDTVGGLRVVRITREQVVIRGQDTTWRLTVREAWR